MARKSRTEVRRSSVRMTRCPELVEIGRVAQGSGALAGLRARIQFCIESLVTGADLTRRLQRLLANAGMQRLRFHDLRHGTASLLTAQGIHPRTIMEILGHSTITVTMNTYAHVAPALRREAASSLDRVFGSGSRA